MIEAYLPLGGNYYILVYSADGTFDTTQQYQLDVTIEEGTLEEAEIKAEPATTFVDVGSDPSVETIFLFYEDRMLARYPDQVDAISLLSSAINSNSFREVANGVVIDLGFTPSTSNRERLNELYAQWDASPEQPLLANEVAQQIWNILDFAIATYYPNTRDLVIVGGDAVIPFYRVPDETTIAPESDYYNELSNLSAFPSNDIDTSLEGSLFYRFIQTDNFYGDREPTPWRGRALYLPDLGMGRLVETPTNILRYIDAHTQVFSSSDYQVRADQTESDHAGAALVTGYDFLSDQAEAVSEQLEEFGFQPDGTLGLTYTLDVLNNDTWDAQDFSDIWFSGQLPQLTDSYTNTQTNYHLMSINSHFSHFDAIPADLAGGTFFSERLLTPTVEIDPRQSYFIDFIPSPETGSATLVYSVGCHSGLNTINQDFNLSQFRADFPAAAIKQAGNWIGNTGYGYGDSDLVGYSERLSLLLTQALGREITDEGVYIGAPIGESLTRAKREYIKTTAPNSFSAFDEKVILQMTLYGLPYTRVLVPNPIAPQFDGAFDPRPEAIPAPIQSRLEETRGIFTRTITFTNRFEIDERDGEGTPRVTSLVEDSFVPGEIPLTGNIQTRIGQPALPSLTYNMTLQSNPDGGNTLIPEVRGIRLVEATTLPILDGFDPHVTTLVTDEIYLEQEDDPVLPGPIWDAWLPDQPYSFQRTEQRTSEGPVQIDKLTVIPAQFRANDTELGELWRYSQMVFEVSYIEPSTAPTELLNDTTGPIIGNINVAPATTTGAVNTATTPAIRISATVSDGDGNGVDEVSVTYTNDSVMWQRAILQEVQDNRYEVVIPEATLNQETYVIVEARDESGNVTVESAKGTLGAPELNFLPIISR